MYKKFLTKKGTIPSKIQQKWLRDCDQVENDESINWSATCLTAAPKARLR